MHRLVFIKFNKTDIDSHPITINKSDIIFDTKTQQQQKQRIRFNIFSIPKIIYHVHALLKKVSPYTLNNMISFVDNEKSITYKIFSFQHNNEKFSIKLEKNFITKLHGNHRVLKYLKKYHIIEGRDCNSSKKELDILQYVKSITQCTVLSNVKNIIPDREIDIYIPDKKYAIEFNGNYYHDKKQENYHSHKQKLCEDRGIKLFQIWENEWVNDKSNILKEIQQCVL